MQLIISQHNTETSVINYLPTPYENDVKVDVNQSFHSKTVNPTPPTGLSPQAHRCISIWQLVFCRKINCLPKNDDSWSHTNNETNKLSFIFIG
jgi:hypothetical protein